MPSRTKFLLLGSAGLIALLLALWLTLRPGARPEISAARADPEVHDPGAAQLGEVASGPTSSSDRELAEPHGEALPMATTAPAAVTAKKRPDLAAREWILFRVKDEHGAPVTGAEIQLAGLRRKSERGSCFAWRGEPNSGKTAADGTLQLPYPVWVDLDDETGEIVLFVRHPEFATLEEQGCQIAPVVDLVLHRGSVLVIAGWIDSHDHVITRVSARFGWDVDLHPEDWLPRRDGRLTTTRILPGSHIVYLVWQSPDRGTCFSDITEFDLAEGEERELFLELKPGKTLLGRFGPEVPRPVVDGEVVIGVQASMAKSPDANLLTTSSAQVSPEGTFELSGLPPGEAQIAGLCRGWASARVRTDIPVPARVLESDPTLAESMRAAMEEQSWGPPSVDLRSITDVYELRMEPTATLELSLRLPDGKPAEGVEISAWPNVCWHVHACGFYLEGRSWTTTSDAEGIVRIEDVPAGEHFFGAKHPDLDLPLATGSDQAAMRRHRARFVSGETVRLSLDLEAKGAR